MRKLFGAAAALLFVLVFSISASSGAPSGSIRQVAISSTAFPGVPTGVRVEQFGFPRVDRQGRVAFKARLLEGSGGVTPPTGEAIWSETAINDLQFVARSGQPIPGIDFRFHDIEPGENLRISRNGDVYFISGMSPLSTPSFNSGIFRFTKQGGLKLVVSSSPTGVPGIPSAGTSSIANFLDFNEARDITFAGSSLNFLLPSGGGVTLINGSAPKINDLGEVAARVGDPNLRLTVRNPLGAIRTLAAEGAMAPGAAGAQFGPRWLQSYDNTTGATVFTGSLIGGAVTDDNDFGVWAERAPGTPVKMLAREGEPAPGAGAGVVWSDFDRFSSLVSYGQGGGIAMRLGMSGPGVTEDNKWGVWSGTVDKGFHLAARAGDQAPGTEPGTVFDFFSQAGVTRDGRSVFFAYLTGPGLNPNRDRGIWAEGIDGLLHLVVRRGDTTVLSNGATATLSSVQFDPYYGVSELGEIAFVSETGRGEGVFASNVVAVPEPASMLMAAAWLSGLWMRRPKK